MTYTEVAARVSFVCIPIFLLGGCASYETTPGARQANADTVDVCETRGTKTICSRHLAADYAVQMERYRELDEMRQLEQSEEW